MRIRSLKGVTSQPFVLSIGKEHGCARIEQHKLNLLLKNCVHYLRFPATFPSVQFHLKIKKKEREREKKSDYHLDETFVFAGGG